MVAGDIFIDDCILLRVYSSERSACALAVRLTLKSERSRTAIINTRGLLSIDHRHCADSKMTSLSTSGAKQNSVNVKKQNTQWVSFSWLDPSFKLYRYSFKHSRSLDANAITSSTTAVKDL